MRLIDAATRHTVLGAALAYADQGISVLPLMGKKPTISWDQLNQRRASKDMIESWSEHSRLHNVGIIGGQISGGLVVIDCDGVDAIMLFKNRFPELATQTYTVLTGSGRGAHYYFLVSIPTKSERVMGLKEGNIELRSDGLYVVAPPSIHPDTKKRYQVGRPMPVKRVSSLIEVSLWLAQLAQSKVSASAATKQTGSSGEIRHSSKYGIGALNSECAQLKAVQVNQNDALNRAAFKLGALISDGALMRGDVERALMDAMRVNGYIDRDGESAALRTVQSGLTAGMRSSRNGYKRG